MTEARSDASGLDAFEATRTTAGAVPGSAALPGPAQVWSGQVWPGQPAHRVVDVRAAESALMATVPAGTLMARAATGLAVICARALRTRRGRVGGSRVVVLVGRGDNGGDALYAAADLASRGASVAAVLLAPGCHAGGLAALRAAGGRAGHVDVAEAVALIAAADLVLDGIVGIGGSPGLRAPADRLAAAAREASALVVAVDLPSGIHPDTGEVPADPAPDRAAAVTADITVCFGTLKPGLLVAPGRTRAGTVVLVDIGLAPWLAAPAAFAVSAADARALVPHPHAGSDKYRRGVVGVVAGSEAYSGAAVLSVGGALRGGAGMVRYVGSGVAADAVRRAWPEVVLAATPRTAGRVQAWVVGPGLGLTEAAAATLAEALAADVPVLVDADGLTLLGRAAGVDGPLLPPGRRAPTLLTPHAGECGRLLGVAAADVEARRLHHASALAARAGCVVLLKGTTTVVAAPGDAPALVVPDALPALATAGSGDVLAGLVGSLIAQGLAVPVAAAVGAALHGAADLPGALAAGDLVGLHPGVRPTPEPSAGENVPHHRVPGGVRRPVPRARRDGPRRRR